MMPTPDIEQTDRERELFDQIRFLVNRHEEVRASIMPMVALSESLLKRGAIPEVRLLYFTDPERNPGGRGKSRQNVFERNGTSGSEILAHPHFMKYLKYFVCGPNLPFEVITEFKEAARFSGYLTGGDVVDLILAASRAIRRQWRVDCSGLPRVLAAGGGLVIEGGGSQFGAIGVSGAPGGEADEDCAKAGIKAIADALEF